ncbi:MAG: nicotinate-nucleotide--dimethylbenzimidazole phosphoribosyltransferase [Actinomycetota bacterium]|nr:nicotinate-nucleotide--dimethylbenzimidazole phosphoribosyltransferase [Actinomycetota bacterium]MEC7590974.1 nicotinate-nucleotide--dimethylbenzimidazole phosphoribosyltransferase [Actinomycetota bacterium]MEC8647192.1 nicotinate-nucleotide--dimethylbenzimidazole phosphoribosyltransferase [Actinomycetota bacterium]MEC9212732.1 nicotinate-nucleotide--dimethylbenzimidazole phosphoribosyltransferase [Actinomycetota bacterium]MED6330929.1 nicotinate-nucleotide--dimethylbenzimidazole phosphoribo
MANDDPNAVTGDLARLRDWWANRRGDRERSIAWILDPADDDEARRAVDRAIDSGATLIALHIDGDDSASRAVIAFVANVPATDVVEQRPGTTDHAWMEAVAEVRDLLEPFRGVSPEDDGVDSAAHALPAPGIPAAKAHAAQAAITSAAQRETAIIFDGLAAHAGAALVSTADSRAQEWMLPATSSTDPAIREAQILLDIEPATHFGTNGGDATSLRAVLSLLDVVDPA